YEYAREDAIDVDTRRLCESNRPAALLPANVYLHRVRYGNTEPYLPTLAEAGDAWPAPDDVPGQRWLFEVVLDYGNHAGEAPTTLPSGPWRARVDAFSRYRAGFEVRTHRLCRRVLMFHHFPEEL